MKLSRITCLLVAIFGVAVVTADEPLLRGGEHERDLAAYDDFDYLKIYYDPKASSGKKCLVKYRIDGEDDVVIYFDNNEINEDSNKVVCTKKVKGKGGVDLPFKEDLDLDDVTWKGEVPRDADVRWKKEDGDDTPTLYAQIKRVQKWEAKYDPDGDEDKKCYLQYKYKTDEITKFYFKDKYVTESSDSKVVCKQPNYDDFPEGLSKVAKDLTDYAEWVDEEVRKAGVLWHNDDDGTLRLTIEKEKDDEPEDVYFEGYYNPKAVSGSKCWLKYWVGKKGDGDGAFRVYFDDNEIRKDGDDKVVCGKRDEDPEGGLKLPIDEDITDDTRWKNEKVKYANVSWFERDGRKRLRLTIEKEKDDEPEDVYFEGYYNPKARTGRKCILKYWVGDKGDDDDAYEVYFADDQIKRFGDDKVVCGKREDPEGGLKLPIDEDITDDTTWKNEKVKYANVRWFERDGRKRVRLTIEKEEEEETYWEAYYNSNARKNRKCWLKYRVGSQGAMRTVWFDDNEIKKNGNDKVTCYKNDEKALGRLDLPVEADITEYTEWQGSDVEAADVVWLDNGKTRNSGKLTLQIRREREKGDDEVEWKVFYDRNADVKCYLRYKVDGNTFNYEFDNDNVDEKVRRKTVVCMAYGVDKLRGGLEPPVVTDIEAEWEGEDVDDADLAWRKTGKLKVTIESK